MSSGLREQHGWGKPALSAGLEGFREPEAEPTLRNLKLSSQPRHLQRVGGVAVGPGVLQRF